MKIRRFTGTDMRDAMRQVRAALQFGPGTVGLVTPDAQSLTEALAALAKRRLVLVDTAGIGQRDPRLPEQLRRLAATDTGVTTLLALPANTASSAMQEIVDPFRTAQPAGCILTKTDEATSLGGALSVLIRGGLKLAYVANGQRVPEDLHLMRNRQTWLAKMVVELMRRDSRVIDVDTLARNFSEVATHAYA